MTPDAQWFFLDEDQQQNGPVTLPQLQQLIAGSHVKASQLVWTEGMPDWVPANQVPEFQGYQPQEAPASSASNPYAAPGTQSSPQLVGGAYPAPYVKKTSFMLYLGFLILAAIILGLTMFSTASQAPAGPDLTTENRGINEAETKQELTAAQEVLDQKKEEYVEENTEVLSSLVGIGLIGFILSIILFLLGAIYRYVILYRAWHILQPGGARTSPGKAVGFMLIPIFSVYWVFQAFPGWASDWNRIRASYPDLQEAPTASKGTFIAGLICLITGILAPIGLILLLIGTKQMCDVINFFAKKQNSLSTSFETSGTLPTLR